jgi:ABC-2 type transport system ATP-binding protein
VNEPIVAALDVHKRYGKKRVLMGASFRAHAGEIIAILGENGGGKSTLLRILAGAIRADGGRVAIAGKAGFCPQDCVLYPYLTPDEHLDLFGCAQGLAPRRVRERADVLFDTFGFSRHRKRLVHELSGGTRQKLNLALALLADPPLLLLDEPYNGFDVETYHCFLDWSDDAKRAGKCIIVVTHIAFDRERFDRILTLRDGVLDEGARS